jgi:hypothetical protein|tara:strand:- start:169 stop:468 length:300 start_codon:yes stop_codon:yes gene_type:complete
MATRCINLDRASRRHRTGGGFAIYESLAFSRATGIFEVVLVYPRTVEDAPSSDYEVGHAAEFARAVADGVLIRAVELGVCRISERRGLKRFADALAKGL